MKNLKYCSSCGKLNNYGLKEGLNRYFCNKCNIIHYENPKPTATLICPRGDDILLVKRAFEPAIGEWSLPGGFMELNETLEQAAIRELKEETNLDGNVVKLLGNCSHFNSIFGDILLLGIEMKIDNWSNLKVGDDASEAAFYNFNNHPPLAFECHIKILNMYIDTLK